MVPPFPSLVLCGNMSWTFVLVRRVRGAMRAFVPWAQHLPPSLATHPAPRGHACKPGKDLARLLPGLGGVLATLSVTLRRRGYRGHGTGSHRPRSTLARSAQGPEAKPPGALVPELDVMKEVDPVTISQRLLKPRLDNGWTLVGDLLTTLFLAPMLSAFFIPLLQPDWYRRMPDGEAGFIFPEGFHGVVYALSWLLGGLALGAFEDKAVNSKNLLATIQRSTWAALVTLWLASSVWLILGAGGWLASAYATLGYEFRPQPEEPKTLPAVSRWRVST